MKSKILALFAVVAMTGLVSVQAFAEETKPATQEDHSAHGAGATTPATEQTQDAHMGHMMAMHEECMKNHKDGKMCNHDMMTKCHEKMGQGDCQKMMKNMKKHSSKKK